ncbi:MAG TPA: hypothetical protein VIK81_02250, partial [Patescibacteria group bacterium]
GKLTTIPHHQKYKEDLLPISKLLKEAAGITSNKAFAKRLSLQADALLDGTYEVSDIYWLTMDPYKIQIVIGPLNRYDDKLFFRKATYEGWVGVVDEDATREALQFKDLFAVAERRNKGWDKIDIWDKLKLRVDNTLIYAGFGARSYFTAYNLPDDPSLIEKYGSEITFFGPAMEMKFETRHLPIFQQLFHPEFQRLYSRNDLKKADLRNIIIHELGHPLLRYKHAPERLKELFPVFDEIAASIIGIKNAGTLVLKDFISQKELEAILVMFICWALDWSEEGADSLNIQPFVTGNAIALNYFFESGALNEVGGISWPNFTKMFMALTELSQTIERILASGTYEEAEDFIKTYGDTYIFNRFNTRLSKFFKLAKVRQ